MIRLWRSSSERALGTRVMQSTLTTHLPGIPVRLVPKLAETNTYVYDFKGRVKEPSIKNFQLIPEVDGRRHATLHDFVLQFGKIGKSSFIVDV
jgi:hypothetical protein